MLPVRAGLGGPALGRASAGRCLPPVSTGDGRLPIRAAQAPPIRATHVSKWSPLESDGCRLAEHGLPYQPEAQGKGVTRNVETQSQARLKSAEKRKKSGGVVACRVNPSRANDSSPRSGRRIVATGGVKAARAAERNPWKDSRSAPRPGQGRRKPSTAPQIINHKHTARRIRPHVP